MKFLKMTVIGGIVFLVPIIIVVIIVGKAFAIMTKLASPLAAWLPIDSVGGIALANLLAAAAIVVVCFVAGLVARSPFAVRTVESLESGVLSVIPGYAFIKGLTGSLTGGEEEKELAPVLARFDDAWQVAFQVERTADGRVVVYIPGAPDPWSGAVFVMTADRVEPLERTMAAAVRNIRSLGRGSAELLQPRPR
jgi:uncharacterized membrane protein